jgi:hypothetical protein
MTKNIIYQVVSIHSPHDWIVRHREFDVDNFAEITDYIVKQLTDDSVNEVKITRWNKRTRERE